MKNACRSRLQLTAVLTLSGLLTAFVPGNSQAAALEEGATPTVGATAGSRTGPERRARPRLRKKASRPAPVLTQESLAQESVTQESVAGDTSSRVAASVEASPDLSTVATFAAALTGDTDGDGVDDSLDNCTAVANPDQRDTDSDGYGNRCDADFNNNGIVDSQDAGAVNREFGLTTAPDHDLNGNGVIDSQDGALVKVMFGLPPGPSAFGTPAPGPFPLRVEPGKRYLVDAQGQPYFLNGDTAWALMVQLDLAGAEEYLEDRHAKGMNTVLIELIESTHGTNAPDNYAGDGPFLTPGDFSTPNEAYFAHAEAIIKLADAKGMLVLLTPAYLGYQGDYEGWYPLMIANGVTKLRNYGRYLGQRFAGYDNILWVHGGDYDPPAQGVALARAVAEGIRDIDTTGRWQHTFHADRNTSALDSAVGNEPWLTTDVIYTSDTNVVEEAYSTWNSASLPYFLYEAQYEDPDNGLRVRKQAYQALLSGAHGHVMGNDTVWRFKSGWRSFLDSEGARSMPAIKELFTSREWWLLAPDTGRTFLTGGVNPGPHHAPAALASDRGFGLVYPPEVRQLTVNLARLAGPRVTARWFDPVSATYSSVAGSPFVATGSRAFLPPGNNSAGDGDWVLVLQATP